MNLGRGARGEEFGWDSRSVRPNKAWRMKGSALQLWMMHCNTGHVNLNNKSGEGPGEEVPGLGMARFVVPDHLFGMLGATCGAH